MEEHFTKLSRKVQSYSPKKFENEYNMLDEIERHDKNKMVNSITG